MNIISNLVKSFSTEDGGFSARKLSAFAAVVTSVYITVKLLPKEVQIYALCAWLLFALLCLGLVTGSQLVMLKNGNSETKKTDSENGNGE
jgi:hypothetical protein